MSNIFQEKDAQQGPFLIPLTESRSASIDLSSTEFHKEDNISLHSAPTAMNNVEVRK